MILQQYEQFCKEIDENSEKITDDQRQKFIESIKKLDKNEHENIYILIKKYYIDDLNDNMLSQSLPYGAKKLKKSIKFNLEKFPEKLEKILILYINNL